MEMFGKRMMMTLVGGLSLLFVAACGTLPTVTAMAPVPPATLQIKQAVAGVDTVGDVVLTGAYCAYVDVPFMKTFTAMLVREGNPGYWVFLQQRNVPCYDTRLGLSDGTPIYPVKATLLERMWNFELPGGKHYVMWRAEDEHGNEAFTWTKNEGQPA